MEMVQLGELMTVKVVFSAVLGAVLILLLRLYNDFFLKPKRLRSKLEKQGIRGPPPFPFLGNLPQIKAMKMEQVKGKDNKSTSISHDWVQSLFPHFLKWKNEYGPVFLFTLGTKPSLCITDIDMAREIKLYTALGLGKPSFQAEEHGPLMGKGILTSNGPFWVHQRKIIAPELYLDKVKGMVNLMVESVNTMAESWGRRIDDGLGVADFKIDDDLRILAAGVIARACFGSNYLIGGEIFGKLKQMHNLLSLGTIGVPGLRHFPTKINREIWKLEKEIHLAILAVVKQRAELAQEKDLLQLLLKKANNCLDDNGLSSMFTRDRFIVDNCKNIYFAGHESTSITGSWCLFLIAAYPDWQSRARAEVLDICKGNVPNADMLSSMKTLTAFIKETLRLYSPAAYVSRQALENVTIKGLDIPKGMNIQIALPLILKNPDLWGPDVHEFNPERFLRGDSKMTNAYMPFGVGPRICLGKHFAMVELKITLSVLLSKFSFSLSPAHVHSPSFNLVVEPGEGVRLCMKRV
ncbi:hypothetical protein ACFE04_026654 [Oxalis oulophora]